MANNTFLDCYENGDGNVYYKLYLNRDGVVTIVCLQDFDENDYDYEKFYKIASTENQLSCVAFHNEDKARVYLNDKFRVECIDPDYRNSQSLFSHMLKGGSND